jgi:hypothetical protein
MKKGIGTVDAELYNLSFDCKCYSSLSWAVKTLLAFKKFSHHFMMATMPKYISWWIGVCADYASERVKCYTVKLELASQPCHFFRVFVYESVQAWLIVQSGWSRRLRNSSTRKSIALTNNKILLSTTPVPRMLIKLELNAKNYAGESETPREP